jgi:hypothetical protein
MRAEDFRKQTLEVEGWSVYLSSYCVGGRYVAEVEVDPSGVTIARVTDKTRAIAEELAMEAAARRLNRARRFDFDLTVGG